jgi:hypothetical protein
MFRKLNSNDFAFEIKSQDLQDVRWQLDLNNRRMTLGLLCAGLFIASSLSMTVESGRTIWGYPLFAMIYFGLASLLLFLIFLGLIRKQ